jgi:ATP-dependent RNA helicase SUPV3L1/SUV3
MMMMIRSTRSGTRTLTLKRSMSQRIELDLSHPQDRYEAARSIKRKFVLHTGPTNSGKTHAAIVALKRARSGVYCGPLRLLAWETCERLRDDGIPTDLLTGQENDQDENATHVSCTVEMLSSKLSSGNVFDVAVIDEAQLIGDPVRGCAWTAAILGCPALEIHLCGSASVTPLVRRMVQETGDELEERTYERLSPLRVADNSMSSLDEVRHGDAVVVFTRRDLFKYKMELQKRGHRCSIVYGALPPVTRRKQAQQFNDTSDKSISNVLVTTDAVGLGLNLRIGRIVFTTLRKFDGEMNRFLTGCEIKQIGGRAGRFGTEHAEEGGIVTALDSRDLKRVRAGMKETPPSISRAGVSPELDELAYYWKDLQDVWPDIPFSDAIAMVTDDSVVDEDTQEQLYFLCDVDDMYDNAVLLDRIDMSVEDRLRFCMAPVHHRPDSLAPIVFRDYARQFAKRGVVRSYIRNSRHQDLSAVPTNPSRLADLEELYRVLEMYMWLATRYDCDTKFPDLNMCIENTETIAEAIDAGLEIMSKDGTADKKRRRGKRGGYGRKGRRDFESSARRRAKALRQSKNF